VPTYAAKTTVRPLEGCPATAAPLPIAWDGATISWGEWEHVASFICARSLKRSQAACLKCGQAPRASLTIRGSVGAFGRQLLLLRCPGCSADSVVDWAQAVWDLDECDYGPGGSWSEHDRAPDLFTTFPPAQCAVCGREGDAGMPVDDAGTARCEDDDLCARRAQARGKDE